MKVIYRLGTLRLKKTAIALGIFDGLHRGHQLLIKSMVTEARKLKAKATVITFFPHPAHVFRPGIQFPYLMSLQQRVEALKSLGVDIVIVIPFNKRFAQVSPGDFVGKILVGQLGAKSVFVGENFRFGKDRSGDVILLKELSAKYGYRMHAVKTLKQGKEPISSGRLRRIIPEGDLKQAKQLLGRPVSAWGKVVKGASRGKALGYPTANVHYEQDVLPPHGVYAVRVIWKKRSYYGMANLGIRPSFKDKEQNPKTHLEVHIFDFNHNLYGQDILVEFFKKIRDEKKFPSKELLVLQIQRDEKRVRSLM